MKKELFLIFRLCILIVVIALTAKYAGGNIENFKLGIMGMILYFVMRIDSKK